jgi:quercetin dioxygenase-like cupin family protein
MQNHNISVQRLVGSTGSSVRQTASPSLDELRLKSNGRVPPHRHKQSDQLYYVLKGEIMVKVESKESAVGEGSSIEIPHGAAHSVSTRQGATFLVFSSPERVHTDTFTV